MLSIGAIKSCNSRHRYDVTRFVDLFFEHDLWQVSPLISAGHGRVFKETRWGSHSAQMEESLPSPRIAGDARWQQVQDCSVHATDQGRGMSS